MEIIVVGIGIALSLPYWLPNFIVRLRVALFTAINGDNGVPVPGPGLGLKDFKPLYQNPAVRGRSKGAALSDLFWYWLSPGPEMHQEHLEDGPLYEEVARTTRRILNVSPQRVKERLQFLATQVVDDSSASQLVRLRDWVMPIWADFYYETVFEEPCPPAARRLIVDNASDVVNALKLTQLRHMKTRDKLTQFLVQKIRDRKVAHPLPEALTDLQKAYYLQGVYFNTAIVQMSEATTHLLLHLAKAPLLQQQILKEQGGTLLNRVIAESFRVTPLFGVAHRIVTENFTLPDGKSVKQGTVLCFDYEQFHHAGVERAEQFDPSRWESTEGLPYLPFGAPGNRPCPAQAIALISLREVTVQILRRFALHTSVSHSRSIPHRGPCWVTPRGTKTSVVAKTVVLYWVRLREAWESVGRSGLQLIFGTYMLWHARRLALCRTHFEPVAPGGCPFRRLQDRFIAHGASKRGQS